MASNQGRTGADWNTARAITIANQHQCWICHKPVDKRLTGRHSLGPHVHHEPPMASVGITDHATWFAIYGLGGLKLVHQRCNLKQGAKPDDQDRQRTNRDRRDRQRTNRDRRDREFTSQNWTD